MAFAELKIILKKWNEDEIEAGWNDVKRVRITASRLNQVLSILSVENYG